MKHILEEEILRQLKLMRINKDNLLEQSSSQLTNQQKDFCQKLTSSELAGGVDTQTMSKNRKEHPECYKEKTVTNNKSTDLRSKTLYSNEVKYRYDLKNKSDEARLARYKSGHFKNIYDLIYLDELGKKNYSKEIKNLKYNVNSISAFGLEYEMSEKDDAIKKGYDIFLKALNNRRKNAKNFGWTGDEIYKPTEFDVEMPLFFQMIPLSTAIDPTYIEAIMWVELKEKFLKLNYEVYKLKKSIKDGYYSVYRKDSEMNYPFNDGRVNNRQTLSGGGLQNNNNQTSNQDKKIDDLIKSNPKYVKLKSEIANLQKKIDNVTVIINQINQWNTSLALQRVDWAKKSCFTEFSYKIPKNQQIQIPNNQKSRFCTGQFIKYKMTDVCKQKNQGGLWLENYEMKWRNDFKGIDFKKLELKFKSEKRPNYSSCGCATGTATRLEYDKVNIKSEVFQECVELTEPPRTSYKETGIIKNFNIEPKNLENVVVDVRPFIEKVTDWGKNCFTGKNEEGKSDYHCLLDVASVAAVFIPYVGPIVSMLLDVTNGMYYVVDAFNANNNLDRNSAILSASLTILGGIATGYGQLRSVMLAKPNGKSIVAFSDTLLNQIQKRGLKTETEIQKLTEELLRKFKLTDDEAKLASNYIKGIKTIKFSKLKGALKEFKDTFNILKTKLGKHNFNLLMENKNFKDILIRNRGNIITSLQEFSKKEMNREFLTQIGFFVGGESILPKLIGPWIENKVKTGDWGTLKQQIESSKYDFNAVKKEFGVTEKSDYVLLKNAWNDPKAIKVDGRMRPWRPSYPVPLKYQTKKYKENLNSNKSNNQDNSNESNFVFDIDAQNDFVGN